STVGIPGAAPATAAAAGGRGGGRGQTTPATPSTPTTPAVAATATVERARGPEDRPSTTSWLIAADEIQATDRRIETVRSGGITTAVTFPTRGIFAGQGSIIDLLSGERAGEMVLVPSVGQYISLSRGGGGGGGGGGGFPSSLMGTISYIRQIYLDAAHYKLVKDAYAKDPRGIQRPEYDHALEGVLESKRILLPANRLVEIDRMLRFAAELKQPAILYGARESYRPEAVELLKKSGAPVLVSMRWPEPPRDANPEDVDSLQTLETRDQAASAPAVLQKAGVQFALYSDGLDQPRDIQRAVKKAIDAGLAREDAIRALTLAPARIYGVADRVGSIEKGKIANLIVTRGELFDDRTRIEMIFVDGRKYTLAADAAPGGRGPVTDDPGVNR
ncbi:MAG: amidohydrolase family protein, partial [Acidobacteriia bacterium]|nr:amidohydrolase family protein [Terriglobia bacterium]